MGLFSRRKEPNADTDGTESSDGAAIGHSDSGAARTLIERVRKRRVTSHGLMAHGIRGGLPTAATHRLGSLLVPTDPADSTVKLQVQADPNTGVVSQFSLVTQDSAVQVQPYAAPRSGGCGKKSGANRVVINKSGGLVEKADGSFGVELRAQVTGQDGKAQPARFCGVDGPRWFLRFVFLGKASRDSGAAEALEKAIRGMVVVRGNDAMPMGNALPLRVPRDETGSAPSRPPRPSAPPSLCRSAVLRSRKRDSGRGLHHPAVIGRGGRNAFRVVPGRGRGIRRACLASTDGVQPRTVTAGVRG